jgi:AhpD family alkylhydroperoxidase
LALLQKRFGKILNLHGGMAHHPVVLAAHRGLQEALTTHGGFDEATRQAVALAVAAVNGCDYCQAAHTLAGERAGLSTAQTVAIRGGCPVEPKLDALLAVARETAAQAGVVEDHTWKQALEAGWSLAELAELFAHVAANVFTNYFNQYNRTELDLPPAP